MTSQTRQDPIADTAILSTFANDPDMRELIDLFVAELPGKIAEVHRIVQAGDLAALRRTMHTLRGTFGGYGYADLGASAGRIEEYLHAHARQSAEDCGVLDRVRADVDALIEQCSRVSTRVGT